jgi:teichuronic acid biosynthesis glycosyltransferase TuaH
VTETEPPIRIVAFPMHDWRKASVEGFRTRDAHLLQAFERSAAVERILVVDRPVSLAERLIRRQPRVVRGREVAVRRSRSTRGVVTEVADKTTVLDIAVPDVLRPAVDARRWWFDVFARADVASLIDWAASEVVGPDRRVVAWLPTVAPVVLGLRPSRLVYDSLDNWLIHPVFRRQAVQARQAYGQLLSIADAVFVSAPASAAALAEWRSDVTVLPNGVDPGLFHRMPARPDDLPVGPVVGYVGKLAKRIDTELILSVANALRNVSFVFVGPTLDRRAVEPLHHAANVVLLGDRAYELMPAYIKHFDVAWIPHRVGEGETGGDPIKLYEYWAADRQVVSTPIDGMTAWRDQLHLVANPAQAIAAIGGLLAGTMAHKTTTVPPDRTWDAIAGVLVRALARELA